MLLFLEIMKSPKLPHFCQRLSSTALMRSSLRRCNCVSSGLCELPTMSYQLLVSGSQCVCPSGKMSKHDPSKLQSWTARTTCEQEISAQNHTNAWTFRLAYSSIPLAITPQLNLLKRQQNLLKRPRCPNSAQFYSRGPSSRNGDKTS